MNKKYWRNFQGMQSDAPFKKNKLKILKSMVIPQN